MSNNINIAFQTLKFKYHIHFRYILVYAPKSMQFRNLIQRVNIVAASAHASLPIITLFTRVPLNSHRINQFISGLTPESRLQCNFFKLPFKYKNKTPNHLKPNDVSDHAVVIAYALTVKQTQKQKTNPTKIARPRCTTNWRPSFRQNTSTVFGKNKFIMATQFMCSTHSSAAAAAAALIQLCIVVLWRCHMRIFIINLSPA